jgi:zinc-ribbon domain
MIKENKYMFCPRCNNPLEENAAFCGVCGALIRPQRDGETVVETFDSMPSNPRRALTPTVYVTPQQQSHSGTVTPKYGLPDKQFASQSTMRETPSLVMTPVPDKNRKKLSKFFVFFVSLAIVTIAAVVAGGIFWFQARTPSSTPSSAQVSFLNSQNNASGTTDALKITATNLPNPPDGSHYDAWLTDTANEQILPLGTLSKSDPNTFAVSFPNAGSPSSQVNLVGAGNRIEITQEQGNVTVPSGKVLVSATFPPRALVHIRHLLVSFPATPANVALLTGLLNETQKVNALSVMLQNSATTNNTASVACIAQAIVNVIEGKNGKNYRPLSTDCGRVGIGDAVIGDGFGILGNGKDGGYVPFASQHAALAASQSDATDTIRQFAKDVETSTDSIKGVITNIDNDALRLLASPAITTQVSEIVSLSDHAFHGFDQNGNGKIEPTVGEAGAVTAYTSGQRMATLTLTPSP